MFGQNQFHIKSMQNVQQCLRSCECANNSNTMFSNVRRKSKTCSTAATVSSPATSTPANLTRSPAVSSFQRNKEYCSNQTRITSTNSPFSHSNLLIVALLFVITSCSGK